MFQNDVCLKNVFFTGLVQQDIYLALNRHCVMASAIKIIKENIPEVSILLRVWCLIK